jgi:hypothetical protein
MRLHSEGYVCRKAAFRREAALYYDPRYDNLLLFW